MSAVASPSAERVRSFCDALRPRLAGDLRTDAVSRGLYATDASMYQIMPVAVLIPRHTGDVQAALEVAHEHDMPVLPRGGGSSLAGQGVAAALVIDFTRHLDSILEMHPEEQWARVEPGVVLDALNAAAAEHGLMVGPDPASSNRATLGGMLANNATGTHSIQYGNFVHHVREVEALLADGSPATFEALGKAEWQERLRRGGLEGDIYRGLAALLAEKKDTIRENTTAHWRRASGYRLEHLLGAEERNLARLLCGSEGTLAVATEITCDLVAKPAHTALGIAHFATRDDALRAVTTVLETDPSAVELFDGVAIERTRQTPGYAERLSFIEGEPGAVLIVEYAGDAPSALRARLDALEDTLRHAERGYNLVRVTAPDAIDNVWSIRKEGLGLVMGVKSDYKPWAVIEDASVPVEHLADYIDDLSAMIDATDTKAVYYAHASAGCLHVRPFINTKDPDELEKMRRIAAESMRLVKAYGGALASEHGDGIVRGALNKDFLGEALYDTYRRTKAIFDPKHLLNPGTIIDTPAMDEHLRMGPDYEPAPFETTMDFSADGGFVAAVERCNGNGACRKLHSGTMCPSFMATREEEDSTRGRANALRLALAGELDGVSPHNGSQNGALGGDGAPPSNGAEAALTSERMHEVMDLCIQCKACKTECPSNVDMGKMKTEWLSHYWEENRMPLRTRLFAHQPELARRVAGTPLASAVNWLNRQSPLRTLLDWTIGVDRERPLPPFARTTFGQWVREQARREHAPGEDQPPGLVLGPDEGAPVVLFADTFNNYHTPVVAKAAAAFLAATGHRVYWPTADICCGRTLLSKGRVDAAQLRALKAVEALYPYADRGWPIVGLEPSCLLTLRDEFLDLLPGDPRAETVAEHAQTFEEFVAEQAEAGILDAVRWSPAQRRILLHGHCHQKALIGTDATERALSLPPGVTVEAVDAGCCGMAGAFGYESEHVDISKTMAAQRLVPAIEAEPDDTLIAAPGFSCRSQVKDTTGRTARHPAQLLYAALDR
jgi:FAD/FMN-containing dehydrogenase/Fe-S oxidoreductase